MHRGLAGPLADVAAVAAGIAVQAPPSVPGMPTKVSSPASPSRTAVEMTWPSLAPPPAVTVCPSTLTSLKAGLRQVQHHAWHAGIADQDVRAAAQQPHGISSSRQRRTSAASSSTLVGLGEILGRPTQMKPGVRRQRLAGAYDFFKSAERCHAQGFQCLQPPA